VRANITAAVAKLGADPFNKPFNVAPADALLNPASVDATLGAGLDIVAVLPDGTSANLVELAKANEYLNATVGYQGIKNYFEVWAEQNMSVWEAWGNSTVDNREVFLSFHVAIVNGNAPEGQSAIQAKKGYFLIYAGDVNESLSNQVAGYRTFYALMSGYKGGEPTPTPIPVPSMTIASTPAGTTEAATCSTFTKESFDADTWTAILAALEITDESAYTFSLSGVDCLDSTTSGLTAAQDVTFTVTYEDGVTAAGDAVTGRMVFVYNVTDSKYDMLPEVPSEVSIATEQTKNTVIAEGSKYDANEATDALKVGFSLVSVVATPVSATPTTAPSSGGGSGCSFGFAPLALVLLAPLALLKK
jgi:Synergist-CTERM protein sorting domain-containing protein